MIQKPKIQYIGQFYVYGSEARALEQEVKPKKPWKPLAAQRLEKIEKVYVDPVAAVAIVVAVVMLVTMILGVLQLRTDWAEHQVMEERVHTLREQNHTKKEDFRKTYVISDIRVKALAMGMIPKADAEHMVIDVTAPEIEPEPTFIDDLIWFMKGLFA